MLGRFFATRPALDFLEHGIESALARRDIAYEREELTAVIGYLRAVALHVPFAETMAKSAHWTTGYDVEAWQRDGHVRPLSSYRFQERQTLVARTDPARRALIETKVATFGEHASGLGKFTRTMFARDLRRSFATSTPRVEGVVLARG
jgi:hypothetical protein